MSVDEMHWQDLLSEDPKRVSSRAQCRWDLERGYGVPFLRGLYWVHPGERSVLPEEESIPVEHHLPLVLVLYLLHVKGLPISGKMVTARELPGGTFFFRHLHQLPTQPLEKAFSEVPQTFVEAGKSLGGDIIDASSYAFRINPLPRILMEFRLWPADEEFPAQCVITFDQSIRNQLPLDVIWALTNIMAKRLLDSHPGPSSKKPLETPPQDR